MTHAKRLEFNMTRISYINELYGQEALKRLQRLDARFINSAIMVTLLGAGVADQLEDGRVLSGVGGQYNFVAQGHALEGARSILILRSWRESAGRSVPISSGTTATARFPGICGILSSLNTVLPIYVGRRMPR